MTASWNDARRWRAVRLDAMGDVLMTTPALRAIRESGSGRELVLLTSPAGADAARHVPEVDDVIVYESPWMKDTSPRTGAADDWELIHRLRAGQFDAAVVFTVYSQNPLPAALFAYLAEIPLRAAHCRENPYQLLTDWIAEREPTELIRHESERQLDLVAKLGCRTANPRFSLQINDGDDRFASELLEGYGLLAHRHWILIHPGASASSRRYPIEHFALAADELVERHDLEVLFVAGATEHELVAAIVEAMRQPCRVVGERLDFGKLSAVIRHAPILIANNSGPVNIAAAVGTPVVDLYALTNPQHAPWLVPHRLLTHSTPCAYCYKSVCPERHHDCLRGIEPARVAAAAASLFDETSSQRVAAQTSRLFQIAGAA